MPDNLPHGNVSWTIEGRIPFKNMHFPRGSGDTPATWPNEMPTFIDLPDGTRGHVTLRKVATGGFHATYEAKVTSTGATFKVVVQGEVG